MCQLPTSVRRQRKERDGFTLIEVLVSITILAIGLMSAALLMSITYKDSVRSRYVAEASQLASEKLEDLSRYPVTSATNLTTGVTSINPDAHVFVPSGSTCILESGATGTNCVGSITPALACTGVKVGHCTVNAPATPVAITNGEAGAGGTTSNADTTVSYSDAVYITTANAVLGGGTASNGSLQETYQTVGGATPQYVTMTFSPTGAVPVPYTSTTAPTAGETFDRRWIIEQDQPVAGVRRITVLVTLMDQTVQPPVTFQMSMVRQ